MKNKKLEKIYFLGIFCILLKFCLKISTIVPNTGIIEDILFVIGTIALIIKILYSSYDVKGLFLISIILCISVFGYFATKLTDYFVFLIIWFASKNIDRDKVIRFVFKICVSCLIIHILWYFIMLIADRNNIAMNKRTLEDGSVISRQNFFMTHANVFSSFFCWTLFMYLYLKYNKLKSGVYILLIFCSMCIYFIANSRTTAILLLLFAVLVFIDKRHHKNKILNFIKKYILIICLTISLALILLYKQDFSLIQKLDSILSGRIINAIYALEFFDINLMGNRIQTNTYIEYIPEYGLTGFTLDNLYYSLIINYGLVLSIIFIMLLQKGINKIYKEDNHSKKLIFVIILCIMAIMENVAINILIAFPSLLLSEYVKLDGKREKNERKDINNFTSL